MSDYSDRQKHKPSGILRLDINKPRRSSGGSVEFRCQPELMGEVINERKRNTKGKLIRSKTQFNFKLSTHTAILNI